MNVAVICSTEVWTESTELGLLVKVVVMCCTGVRG